MATIVVTRLRLSDPGAGPGYGLRPIPQYAGIS